MTRRTSIPCCVTGTPGIPAASITFFINKGFRVRQVLENMRGKYQVTTTIRYGNGHGIGLYDRNSGELHGLGAMQAVPEGMLLNDKVGSPERPMAAAYINDKIGFSAINTAQDLLTSAHGKEMLSANLGGIRPW